MPDLLPASEGESANDRRRVERRRNNLVADLTLPEFRRLALTVLLSAIVIALFLWMVREVIIAGVIGLIIALYLRPLYARLSAALRSTTAAAIVSLLLVIVPVVALLLYSYVEVKGVVGYVSEHPGEIAAQIDAAVRKLPFMEGAEILPAIRRWVALVSEYGTRFPELLQETVTGFAISATIFVFTIFYVLTEGERVGAYIRSTIPPRYGELVGALQRNVKGVLYGAIYATLVTQTLKTAVVLAMNLAFGVPLAAVLAILSFIIGFFPIVGSWSVYVPVAAWLLIFRDAPTAAVVILLVGFFVNTIYLSTYLRPKLAAEKSRVLNFYWMLVALVTGVYTFGVAGILLGPVLIGLLKAILDTITAQGNWQLVVHEDIDEEPPQAPVGAPA
jgi:predicted PurR-regulated permease PerM